MKAADVESEWPERLRTLLAASPIYAFDEAGLMDEAIQIDSTLNGTDAIQTYLDLLETGERGREAAEHWRKERIERSLQEAA